MWGGSKQIFSTSIMSRTYKGYICTAPGLTVNGNNKQQVTERVPCILITIHNWYVSRIKPLYWKHPLHLTIQDNTELGMKFTHTKHRLVVNRTWDNYTKPKLVVIAVTGLRSVIWGKKLHYLLLNNSSIKFYLQRDRKGVGGDLDKNGRWQIIIDFIKNCTSEEVAY